MINDTAMELDLLILSCTCRIHKSIGCCTLNTDPILGLAVALAILKNNFDNTAVLTPMFLKDVLASGDRGRVHETVADLHAFKDSLENFREVITAQMREGELNSEMVLHDLF